ncbi:major facilitator superfamily domain-containing protein [Xylariales sp. PMI_506]|nr:major facilitator superfamily domain-containing protein [Xylariales sp. PMI_506]
MAEKDSVLTESQHGVDSLEKGIVDVNTNPNQELFVVQADPLVPIPNNGADQVDSGKETLLDEEPYPEGGLEAWLVVFGSFCGLFAGLGIMNCIAVFQTYVSAHQLSEYSEGTIGWIFSVYTFLSFGGGIFVGPMFDKHDPRWLVYTGGVVVLSLMLMSLCSKYWHFFLAFGILGGIGTSLLFTPCFAAPGHFFREKRGLATGIASSGGGLGGVIFSLMLQSLITQVGWAWSLRIQGFICLFMCTICCLLVKKRLKPASNASSRPDLRILKEKAFLLTTIGVFLVEFGLFIPLAYISSYVIYEGFSREMSFYMLTFLTSASVFGRALPGYWGDLIGPFNVEIISVIFATISCLAIWLPAGHTLPGIIVFVVIYGFSTGTYIGITPVCIGKLCHTQHYGRYYATCYTVVSISCLIGIPIAGSLITATGGSYWGLIVFTGLTGVGSFLSFSAAKVTSVGWKPWVKY